MTVMNSAGTAMFVLKEVYVSMGNSEDGIPVFCNGDNLLAIYPTVREAGEALHELAEAVRWGNNFFQFP